MMGPEKVPHDIDRNSLKPIAKCSKPTVVFELENFLGKLEHRFLGDVLRILVRHISISEPAKNHGTVHILKLKPCGLAVCLKPMDQCETGGIQGLMLLGFRRAVASETKSYSLRFRALKGARLLIKVTQIENSGVAPPVRQGFRKI